MEKLAFFQKKKKSNKILEQANEKLLEKQHDEI